MWQVTAGVLIVVGVMFLLLLMARGTVGDTSAIQGWLFLAGLALAGCLVVGIVLLRKPRRRLVGSGLIAGALLLGVPFMFLMYWVLLYASFSAGGL